MLLCARRGEGRRRGGKGEEPAKERSGRERNDGKVSSLAGNGLENSFGFRDFREKKENVEDDGRMSLTTIVRRA